MGPKDADGMTNSVDPDQTAPREEQSDQCLHCLPRPVCPGHMTNMAAMPIYDKNLKKSSSPEPEGR